MRALKLKWQLFPSHIIILICAMLAVAWYGTQSSQTSLAPDIVVANQVYDWTIVLDEIINGKRDL